MIIRNDFIGIATGAIDIEELEKLVDSNERLKYKSVLNVKWNLYVHLKVYLFKPGNICIIGSSNLTLHGFSNQNLELNVVWKNSHQMFEQGLKVFSQIWDDKSTSTISKEDIIQTRKNLDIPEIKKLKDSINVLKASSQSIYEFSITNKEHQSYQVLKLISRNIRNGKSWASLQKFITNLGKGESEIQSKAKLLFLLLNNIIKQSDNHKIILTDFGKNIISDPYQCFCWLSEIDLSIIQIMKVIAENKYQTYNELVNNGICHSKEDLYLPVHWLASLGILKYSDRKERQWSLSKRGKAFLEKYEIELNKNC